MRPGRGGDKPRRSGDAGDREVGEVLKERIEKARKEEKMEQEKEKEEEECTPILPRMLGRLECMLGRLECMLGRLERAQVVEMIRLQPAVLAALPVLAALQWQFRAP
eukprot:COSAG06_NODE_13987_length_1199_cov_3.262727_1_plen_107_part_00